MFHCYWVIEHVVLYAMAFWCFCEHELIVLIFRVIAANFLPDFSAQVYHVFCFMAYSINFIFWNPRAKTRCHVIYCMHLFCIRKIFVFTHKIRTKSMFVVEGKTLTTFLFSFFTSSVIRREVGEKCILGN